MVQSKVAVDHVEAIIDGTLGPLQRVLYLLRALLMEEAELGLRPSERCSPERNSQSRSKK